MVDGIQIEGTFNVRDVAAGSHGSPLSPGVLFRSATLSHVTPAGVTRMAELGVSTVLDLRSQQERDRDGADHVPDGADVYAPDFNPALGGAESVNAADTAQLVALFMSGRGDADAASGAMRSLYTDFVTGETARAAIGGAVVAFGAAAGATWVHCSAGKDRTGWFVAAVQTLCGLDRETVTAEYLKSNDAAPQLAAMIPQGVGIDAAALAPVLEVRREYLDAAFDALDRTYGGIGAYLAAAGVGAHEQDRARERLSG